MCLINNWSFYVSSINVSSHTQSLARAAGAKCDLRVRMAAFVPGSLSKDTAACFTWLRAPVWNRGPRKINSIHFSGRLIVFYAWPHDLWPSLLSGLSEQAGRGVWLCRPEVRRYMPGCERVLGFVMKLWGWNHSLLRGVVARHVLSQGCHIYSVIRDRKLVYLSCDPGRLIDTSGVARVSALLWFSQGLDSRYRCQSLYVSVFLMLAHSHASSDRLILLNNVCYSDITSAKDILID